MRKPSSIQPATHALEVLARVERAAAVFALLDADNLLAGLAAAYVDRDRIDDEAVTRIFHLFRASGLSSSACRVAGDILRAALSGAQAERVLQPLLATLAEAGHTDCVYDQLIQTLAFAAAWANRLVECASVLGLLELAHLREHRRRLLREVVEPVLYAAGGRQPDALARLARSCGDEPDFRYIRYFLNPKDGEFPLHGEVQQYLGAGPRHVLMVQNIRDGQGDEMIRVVPLMQALLDFNPELEIELITRRAYLYAHTRVTIVPLTAETQLGRTFDAVVDFFETNVLEVNYDCELEAKIQTHLRLHPPKLLIAATKGHNHFEYQRVELGGRDWAQDLHLNEQRIPNIYETTFRLVAELGLPLRTGRGNAHSQQVLAGTTWPRAIAEWKSLAKDCAGQRPVAILNPFGGMEPLKGYVESQTDGLALQIRRLITDGYFVVLAPNGTTWGSAAHAQAAVDRLGLPEKAHVAIAPDAAPGPGGFVSDGFSYADTMTRLLVYFVRFADLVVSVEGWMIHAAYCMSKPYRTLMAPYSHPPEWQPYRQSRDQQIDFPMQFEQRLPQGHGSEDDTEPRALPMLVEQPRKFTLLALLRELGAAGDPQALAWVAAWLRSPDRDLRSAAAQAIGRIGGTDARALLLGALSDSYYKVRAAAAEVLLRAEDPNLPVEQLRTHAAIGMTKRDWTAILRLGEPARPALVIATRDEDAVIRREAASAIEWLAYHPREQELVRTWLQRRITY